jgi:hypothetical protein
VLVREMYAERHGSQPLVISLAREYPSLMKMWMLPWLFPVGLLGAVVFVVVTSPYEAIAGVVFGVLIVPVLWRLHFPTSSDDADTSYWRMKAR